MKLDRMRGLGPWFAVATPVFFVLAVLWMPVVVAGIKVEGPHRVTFAPWFDVAAGAWFLWLALFMVCGLLVAIDLEWIEHPATHTGLSYLALGSMAVATLAYLLSLVLGLFEVQGAVNAVLGFLFLAGLGLYLVLINWVGWRAGLLGRVFPWVGMVAGAACLVASLAFLVYDLLASFLLLGIPLYLLWSLWLAFKLRGQVPDPAPAATSAT